MADKDQIWDKYPRKFGKYHLLGPLAQGGMGALYLAVTGDRGFERLMVIKTVLPHLADAEYVARFRDEAKCVVKLSHGNLIPVFDAGQVEGELFLAMDFVEGRDLRAVWNRCATTSRTSRSGYRTRWSRPRTATRGSTSRARCARRRRSRRTCSPR